MLDEDHEHGEHEQRAEPVGTRIGPRRESARDVRRGRDRGQAGARPERAAAAIDEQDDRAVHEGSHEARSRERGAEEREEEREQILAPRRDDLDHVAVEEVAVQQPRRLVQDEGLVRLADGVRIPHDPGHGRDEERGGHDPIGAARRARRRLTLARTGG
jgi:hypothetical protein